MQSCCLPTDFSLIYKSLANAILSDTSFSPPFPSISSAGRHVLGGITFSPGIWPLPPASLVMTCALSAALPFPIFSQVSLLLSDFHSSVCSSLSCLSTLPPVPPVLSPNWWGTTFSSSLSSLLWLVSSSLTSELKLCRCIYQKTTIGLKYHPKVPWIYKYYEGQGLEMILKSFCFQKHKSFKCNLHGIHE